MTSNASGITNPWLPVERSRLLASAASDASGIKRGAADLWGSGPEGRAVVNRGVPEALSLAAKAGDGGASCEMLAEPLAEHGRD